MHNYFGKKMSNGKKVFGLEHYVRVIFLVVEVDGRLERYEIERTLA